MAPSVRSENTYRQCFTSVDALTGAPSTYCFPKATRTYQGLDFQVERRLTDNLQVQASYTLSRTIGNYPGLFTPENGQLDPNITSQFDLPNLLGNRQGYLPSDRTHIIKLSGSYAFPFGLETGLVANVQSGTPLEYLGAHPVYGTSEAFVLPRGVGVEGFDGRTPWVTSIDASLGYSMKLGNKRTLQLGAQAFNLLNFQQATAVDLDYTYDTVSIAYGGTSLDQVQCWDENFVAKTTCTQNPNFGKVSSYQSPFSVRFNAKFSF
jgi:hypothetical protein